MSPEFFAIAAVAAGVAVALQLGIEANLSARRCLLGGIVVAICALVGARLQEVLSVGATTRSLSGYVGFRHVGAIIGGALAVPLVKVFVLRETKIGDLADAAVVAFLLAVPIWRIGCVVGGCCFGIPTTLPWAIRYTMHKPAWEFQVAHNLLPSFWPYSLRVHPLPIYFGLWAAIVGAALWRLRHAKRYAGELALGGLALHELGKYVLEFLRADVSFGAAYVRHASLVVASMAAVLLVICETVASRLNERVAAASTAAVAVVGNPRQFIRADQANAGS